MEREAAVRSILNGTTDIAFTTGKVVDSLLIQTPVFSEPMVVVASKKNHYSQPVSIQQLPISKQIYIKWSIFAPYVWIIPKDNIIVQILLIIYSLNNNQKTYNTAHSTQNSSDYHIVHSNWSKLRSVATCSKMSPE